MTRMANLGIYIISAKLINSTNHNLTLAPYRVSLASPVIMFMFSL